MKVAGSNIEELMESGRVKEDWYHLAWWYHQVRGIQTPATRELLDQVSEDRVDLYRCRPPEGPWFPLLVRPEESMITFRWKWR